LPLCSHLLPEISAHLLAVSPTSHWLEYVDWANPILEEPLRVEDGQDTSPSSLLGLKEANRQQVEV
jgi:mandelate racemase